MTNILTTQATRPLKQNKISLVVGWIKSVFIKQQDLRKKRKAARFIPSVQFYACQKFGVEEAGLEERRNRLTDYYPQMLAMRLFNSESHGSFENTKY